jgi:alkylhydroperoxidase/carboxymuconolactone decarboxylase family protein YurZ
MNIPDHIQAAIRRLATKGETVETIAAMTRVSIETVRAVLAPSGEKPKAGGTSPNQ